jgi:hypothetical protein
MWSEFLTQPGLRSPGDVNAALIKPEVAEAPILQAGRGREYATPAFNDVLSHLYTIDTNEMSSQPTEMRAFVIDQLVSPVCPLSPPAC